MHEFTCQRCGIRVIDIMGEPHPEILYCLVCRFIENLEISEEGKEALAVMLDRPKEPETKEGET